MVVSGVLILFVATATGFRSYNEYSEKQNVYPINIDLVNDRSDLSVTVPRSTRYVKNLLVCLSSDAMRPLGLRDLVLIARTCDAWEKLKLIHQLSEFRRKWNNRPLVEFGPGSWKPEVSDYHPEDLGKELVRLAALKKRFDGKNKNLNPNE